MAEAVIKDEKVEGPRSHLGSTDITQNAGRKTVSQVSTSSALRQLTQMLASSGKKQQERVV